MMSKEIKKQIKKTYINAPNEDALDVALEAAFQAGVQCVYKKLETPAEVPPMKLCSNNIPGRKIPQEEADYLIKSGYGMVCFMGGSVGSMAFNEIIVEIGGDNYLMTRTEAHSPEVQELLIKDAQEYAHG